MNAIFRAYTAPPAAIRAELLNLRDAIVMHKNLANDDLIRVEAGRKASAMLVEKPELLKHLWRLPTIEVDDPARQPIEADPRVRHRAVVATVFLAAFVIWVVASALASVS